MIKRPPCRNHRSKGIKVKHVLQIILLLGVCFWLIYQVKHSHYKKKEFDENDAKLSVRDQTANLIPNLGRKGLHPGKGEVNQKEKREEEEEDENIVEDEENKPEHHEHGEDAEDERHKQDVRDQGEEENKHGEEEQEEDENKSEETENEGRGGGDDEIDENDQEKPEVDADRDEELVDGEKDTEKEEGVDEKENENIEDEEKEGLVENHNTHEAREEHYKGDDASSAVAHDTHTTSTLTDTYILEKSDENSENKTNNSDESSRNHNDSKIIGGELKDGTSLNVTAGEETRDNSLSNQVDNSPPNNTATTNNDRHLEASSNLTIATVEASNNLVGAGANISNSSEQINKMVIFSESDNARNATVNTTVTGEVQNVQTRVEQSGNRVSEAKLPDSGATNSVNSENLEKTVTSAAASNETQNNPRNLEGRESIDTFEHDELNNTETSKTSEMQNSSDRKENTDVSEDEKSKGETDETSSDTSSDNGTLNSVEHADIDSSDSHIHKYVTQVRTDLDTLSDVRNEGDNGDENAAE